MTKMEELLKQQQDIVAAIAAEFKRGVEEAAKGMADAQYNLAVMHHHRGLACRALGLVGQAEQDLAVAEKKGFDPTRGIF